jgi:exodeoxyribonuclease V alpha subunit
MVTRNDAALGVFNGDVGIVLRAPATASASATASALSGVASPEVGLRCYFLEGEDLRSVAVGRLADVETAFAMTVHKSQGSEFGHVLLAVPDEDTPVLTREWLYTGITRASRALTWAGPLNPALPQATARQTRRISGLRHLLDPAQAPNAAGPAP